MCIAIDELKHIYNQDGSQHENMSFDLVLPIPPNFQKDCTPNPKETNFLFLLLQIEVTCKQVIFNILSYAFNIGHVGRLTSNKYKLVKLCR